jgi:hypothetical protein
MSRIMNNQKTTTLTLPSEVKQKFDNIYEQSRAASSEPRWLTIDRAVDALAEKHEYDVDLEVEGGDQKQTNQVRR